MLYRLVMLESDLAQKVKSQKSEYYNPYCKIYLSVKYSPMICLVCNAEELQTQCYLHESQNNLY